MNRTPSLTSDSGEHQNLDGAAAAAELAALIAERDRIKRQSIIQSEAGTSFGRNPEFAANANKRMKEARDVLSRVWMTPGPMDRLPHDCIIHVMHFMPVQQVFVCMSVNKKWQEAARHTVRIHKRVILVWKNGLPLQKVQIHNSMNLITVKASDVETLAKSLLLMEKLEHLYTNGGHFIDFILDRENTILYMKHIDPVINPSSCRMQHHCKCWTWMEICRPHSRVRSFTRN